MRMPDELGILPREQILNVISSTRNVEIAVKAKHTNNMIASG
jgi:hypothetical protein